jgi:excisionase family DNA binding protein
MNEQPLLVSVKCAAQIISVSARTIQNLLAAKRLVARKIGRRTLILRSSLEQLTRRDTPSPSIEAAEVRNERHP